MTELELPETKAKEEWTNIEKEDYQFYLDHINKFTSAKHSFDAYEILDEGKMPELINNAAMLQCAHEVAYFVRTNDIRFDKRPEYFKNLERFIEVLELPHIMFMMNQFTLAQCESCVQASESSGIGSWKKMINLSMEYMK